MSARSKARQQSQWNRSRLRPALELVLLHRRSRTQRLGLRPSLRGVRNTSPYPSSFSPRSCHFPRPVFVGFAGFKRHMVTFFSDVEYRRHDRGARIGSDVRNSRTELCQENTTTFISPREPPPAPSHRSARKRYGSFPSRGSPRRGSSPAAP